ncbi:MAG: hypothetical protein WD267_03215 [Balneolales bacterium]
MITIQIGKLNNEFDGYLDQITQLEFEDFQEAMSIWNVLSDGISKETEDHQGKIYPFGYKINHDGKCINFGFSH